MNETVRIGWHWQIVPKFWGGVYHAHYGLAW